MAKLIPLVLVAVLFGRCAEEKVGAPMLEKNPAHLELHGDVRVSGELLIIAANPHYLVIRHPQAGPAAA